MPREMTPEKIEELRTVLKPIIAGAVPAVSAFFDAVQADRGAGHADIIERSVDACVGRIVALMIEVGKTDLLD